jgi:hypothetical protein
LGSCLCFSKYYTMELQKAHTLETYYYHYTATATTTTTYYYYYYYYYTTVVECLFNATQRELARKLLLGPG